MTVLGEIRRERDRQDEKWGKHNHPDGTGLVFKSERDAWTAVNDVRSVLGSTTWAPILLEEVFEALAETSPAALRRELVQVASVAVAWIEAIDRRSA